MSEFLSFFHLISWPAGKLRRRQLLHILWSGLQQKTLRYQNEGMKEHIIVTVTS